MKKTTKKVLIAMITILIVGVIILIFFINSADSGKKVSKERIYQRIIDDNFKSNTVIEKKIKENVNITINDISDDATSVEIKAPNITEELYQWVESQNEVNDDAMEEKIMELLEESENEVTQYDLIIFVDDELKIQYTEESKNAMSCGMIEFYNMCMEKVIEDMKEGE